MYEVLGASEFDLETLARLYTRTFEGYAYTAVITPAQLEAFVSIEDLKLELSPVLRVGEELVAFTTVGVRGAHAYCRGFGVIPEFRGKGLANALCAEMIRKAWDAGAQDMVLGVLKENHSAVQTYRRGGFEVTRELHTVEWARAQEMAAGDGTEGQGEGALRRALPTRLVEIEPERALKDFAALHTVAAVWNRDLASLERMTGLQGLAIWDGDALRGYVLFRADGDGVEILDLSAARVEDGMELLRTLQGRWARIVCYNEPEESWMHGAFQAAGFEMTQRRWEMRVVRRG